MKTFSRGTWLALAAVVAVPTTVAIAKNSERMGWRMSPETQSRLENGRIAMVKAALQLNADQEKLWAPVESQVRDTFKARQEKRAEWAKKREERRAEKAFDTDRKRPDLAERYEKRSKHASERADRLKSFSESFKPFYASLSDEQKDVLRPLMHQLEPGFGRHHGGPRWAFGGWGPHGAPAGHRGGHGGWHGERGGHGGPAMQNDEPDDQGNSPTPAEPDDKG